MENNIEVMQLGGGSTYGLQATSNFNGYQLGQTSVINYPYSPSNHYFYNWGFGTTYVEKESKVDKAFKIIKKLMDIKMIKEDISVKEFMELCEVISKEI